MNALILYYKMPPTGYCTCCNKAFKTNLLINCSICKKAYRHACVKLSLEELKVFNDNIDNGLNWSCTGCREFGIELNGLKALILQLQNDLQDLKRDRTPPVLPEPIQMEDIIVELNERNRRKSNLIIFGIDEQNQGESPENRLTSDKTAVRNILRVIDPELSIPDVKPIRLGSFSERKTRPIKITLNTEESVHNLIRKSKILRTHKDYKNKKVSIAFDRTPRQQQYFQKVKQELNERKQSGETNLRIKYVRGMPQIILN